MDTTKIGVIAAEFMGIAANEEIAEDVVVETLQLGEIVIIGEVHWTDTDGVDHVCVISASTTPNRIHQTGIVQWGLELIGDAGTPMTSDEEDDEE